ncbi:MAG: MgtC/SapB family protein [Terricaulis sp.]|nr:MgtC/SapB family protein [Terricaulis sp.]
MPDPILIDTFSRLAMALGIGFLVGVERGWRHREGRRMEHARLACAPMPSLG